MGKKGKKGGKGKGRKSKNDGLTPQEAFYSVQIKMRRKHLSQKKIELMALEKEIKTLQETVEDLDARKNQQIKRDLNRLYLAEDDLETTMVETASETRNRTEQRAERNRERSRKEQLKRLTLENELQTNKNIEEEITKWQNYRAKDHGIDDDEISRLEFVLSNHIDETNKMMKFIDRLVELGKNDSQNLLDNLTAKHRHNAFTEALKNLPPNALYECREADRLEKWVGEQTKFLHNDYTIIDRLQKENLRLIEELEKLRDSIFDESEKHVTVLDDIFFPTKKVLKLPEIPRIELKGKTPPLMSRKSYEVLTCDSD